MKNFYRDGGLVLSVIAQTVITAILAVLLYMHDLRHFWILLPFVVLVCSFTIGKLIVVTHRAFRYVNTLKGEIITADSAALYHSPTAIGIVDKNMRFIWYNPVFAQEFKELAQYDTLHGVALSAITPASTDLLLSESGSRISYGEKYYKINAGVPRENMAGEIYVIYFEDITKESILEIEKRLSHPVVMIIMIDAYEEIFSGENVSESMTASVVVQVDKLLEDYIKKTTGVLRKTGRNKFWAVVEERHINELVDSKVKLLDEARKITVTDRICVTLSFGIGRTGETMAQSEQYARQALEMALGRGGDQAAVKTESGFEFYGGFSKGIERHTNKVRTRLIANSLLDMANSADIIYVMGHKFSDLDSIGSAVGLACGLRNLGKSAYIVIDRGTSLGSGLLKRIERESEKDKDKDKSAPLFIAPEKAIDAWTEKSLLIIVDVHNKKLLESLALYELAEKVVVIDHHRKMVDFIENAAIFHHEVTASSTAEMVTE
ncbi:MAG: DHH family phosphoesterase, partial [Oscillospiraceae bacterium]|nr:DHH family phosphoesterase [Oscillospiraceae bacterium]